MRYMMLALACLVVLTGCMGARLDTDTGRMEAFVEPLVGQTRLRDSEAAAKEYSDTLAQGQVALAEQIGNAEVAASAMEAEVARQITQDKFDLEDILSSEYFYLLIGLAGGGELIRRKRKKWKAETPPVVI